MQSKLPLVNVKYPPWKEQPYFHWFARYLPFCSRFWLNCNFRREPFQTLTSSCLFLDQTKHKTEKIAAGDFWMTEKASKQTPAPKTPFPIGKECTWVENAFCRGCTTSYYLWDLESPNGKKSSPENKCQHEDLSECFHPFTILGPLNFWSSLKIMMNLKVEYVSNTFTSFLFRTSVCFYHKINDINERRGRQKWCYTLIKFSWQLVL